MKKPSLLSSALKQRFMAKLAKTFFAFKVFCCNLLVNMIIYSFKLRDL